MGARRDVTQNKDKERPGGEGISHTHAQVYPTLGAEEEEEGGADYRVQGSAAKGEAWLCAPGPGQNEPGHPEVEEGEGEVTLHFADLARAKQLRRPGEEATPFSLGLPWRFIPMPCR